MVLGDIPDTSAPMEVDRLQSNPKGKDKGKGKFGGKGPAGKGQKGKPLKGLTKETKEEVSVALKENTSVPKARIHLVVVLENLVRALDLTTGRWISQCCHLFQLW